MDLAESLLQSPLCRHSTAGAVLLLSTCSAGLTLTSCMLAADSPTFIQIVSEGLVSQSIPAHQAFSAPDQTVPALCPVFSPMSTLPLTVPSWLSLKQVQGSLLAMQQPHDNFPQPPQLVVYTDSMYWEFCAKCAFGCYPREVVMCCMTSRINYQWH